MSYKHQIVTDNNQILRQNGNHDNANLVENLYAQILTNFPNHFQRTVETGLFDLHKITLPLFKPEALQQSPNIKSHQKFENEIRNKIELQRISSIDNEALRLKEAYSWPVLRSQYFKFIKQI